MHGRLGRRHNWPVARPEVMQIWMTCRSATSFPDRPPPLLVHSPFGTPDIPAPLLPLPAFELALRAPLPALLAAAVLLAALELLPLAHQDLDLCAGGHAFGLGHVPARWSGSGASRAGIAHGVAEGAHALAGDWYVGLGEPALQHVAGREKLRVLEVVVVWEGTNARIGVGRGGGARA